MLDRMEKSGHITRVFDSSDRRTVHIRLTENARLMQGKYNEVSAKMNEIFYEGFTDDEILSFENSLGKILENLWNKENENGQENHK